MEEIDYKIEYQVAMENYNKIVTQIPKPLIEKEDRFYKNFLNSKGSLFKKLRNIYDFMGEIYMHVNKYIPCQKGCNHCCYYNVHVTELEIRYIEKENKIKRNSILEDSDFHGQPCPFLKNGACSIYSSRPFMCRKHIAITPTSKWCEVDKSGEHEFPMFEFSEIEKSFNFLVAGSGLSKKYDIRQRFHAPIFK